MAQGGCDLLEKSYFCSIANNLISSALGNILLWFAWKIVLLQYRKQQRLASYHPHRGCDLLEKSYFCSIANNTKPVVAKKQKLWFAWKIVLLQYRKQHKLVVLCIVFSCDLLEKSYFCSIANNASYTLIRQRRVVICLKNRTFAVSQTTFNQAKRWRYCCDLLEKSYFCSIANNIVFAWN